MKYIILAFCFIVSASLSAAPTCSKNGTKVIYTNGVTTTRESARLALVKIISLNLNIQIDQKLTNDKFLLAYNYEESISRDFLEAAVQRFPAGFLKSIGVTNGYAAYMGYLNGGLADAIYAVALNSITDKLVEIQSNWIINYRNNSLYLQTVQEIKGHYETAFNNGERVFAISHSQGGLFMSDAFDATSFSDKQKYFSGFQVASPLHDEMTSHFGYATHDKDRLINFIRGTVGAVPANITAPLVVNNSYEGISDYALDFVINHGIVTTYLADSNIKSQLVPMLISTAQLLESNCPRAVINYTKNNLVVSFDSTDPQDPNASGLTYSWDFGDGQSANTTSKTFSHTYAQAGTYNVSLIVTDAYGASDSENISIELVNGNSNLEICNGGQSPIKMSFGLSGLESFTLEHVYNYDENGWFTGSTCECKKLSVPANTNISIHVEGIYNLQVIPYDGMINVPANQSLYEIFTNGEMNYPPGYVGPQVFTIVRGVYYRVSCKNFVYK